MAEVMRVLRDNLVSTNVRSYEKRAKELALSVTEANLTKHASDMMAKRFYSMDDLRAMLKEGWCAEASIDIIRNTTTVLMNIRDEDENIHAVSFDINSGLIISIFPRYDGKDTNVNPDNYFGV